MCDCFSIGRRHQRNDYNQASAFDVEAAAKHAENIYRALTNMHNSGDGGNNNNNIEGFAKIKMETTTTVEEITTTTIDDTTANISNDGAETTTTTIVAETILRELEQPTPPLSPENIEPEVLLTKPETLTLPQPPPQQEIITDDMVQVNGNSVILNNDADRVKQHYHANSKPPVPAPKPGRRLSEQTLNSPKSSPSQQEPFTLKLGFQNSATGRYLTAEKFNNKLNCLGTSLKQRQTWTLEFHEQGAIGSATDIIYLKSASSCYLAATSKGAVSCESTERTPECQFVIEFERSIENGSEPATPPSNGDLSPASFTVGRWAIRNVLSGCYLGIWSQANKSKHQDVEMDTLVCRVDKTSSVGDIELWHAQLSASPLVHLKNYGRGNRYAALNAEGEAFLCTEIIPWGQRAILLLEFYDGKYAIRSAANNKYLHREGHLVPCLSRDTLFSLEFKTCVGMQQLNGVVFRDVTGGCLCASGVGMLRSSIRKAITKDELFHISESPAQILMTNVNNRKYVSIKQGMDVSANQLPIEPDDDSPANFVPYTNNEVFQLVIDRKDRWTVLTSKDKWWQVNGAKSGVTANGEDPLIPEAQFDYQWNELDGSVTLKSVSNGLFVKANPTGALQATTNGAISDKEKFYVDVINRPSTVFRGPVGFIGVMPNNQASTKGYALRLDCSRVTHDVFELIQRAPGTYAIKAVSGKFWRVVDGDLSVVADCDDVTAASWFRFEFRKSGRAAIRHAQNPTGAGLLLLVGEQSGLVVARGKEINDHTLWEM